MERNIILLFLLFPFIMNAQPAQRKGSFTVRSTDVGGQATTRHVFNGSGCTGENKSPQLSWEHVPEGTKSFAITMHDPDAPTGSGWWHWVVYNIPSATMELPSGAGSEGSATLPKGSIQGRTDFGTKAYGGPCPPEGHGPHRYIVTVHAVDTEKLEVPEDASPAMIGFNLHSHSLARASLVFYYER